MDELTAIPQIKADRTNSVFEVVIDFLKENNWSFSQHETEPIIRMGYEGENGEWTCVARTREIPAQFVFYSIFPIAVPQKKRVAIAEFITRVNFGLIVGNFEMDFQDGELRYKTYGIDTEDNSISSALIKQLIFINVMTMDRYLPELMSVIYANLSPEDAISGIVERSEV
jgi:hypothetical protein